MNCRFDICELINIVFGGIITGLVASFLFVWLSNKFRECIDSRKYRYLASPKGTECDWICYSMKNENGRIRGDDPNGSTVTISHEKGNILNIRLKQENGRVWNGKLTMTNKYVGTLSFHYENEHEYGFKDVFIGEESEDGKSYDFLFLLGKGKDYGNELIRREKTSR